MKFFEFFVGARYKSSYGHGTRTIVGIYGDDIDYVDDFGPGRCSKETFSRWAGPLAPDSPIPPQPSRRPKPIKAATIQAIRRELGEAERLKPLALGIKSETLGSKPGKIIGLGVWQFQFAAVSLAEDIGSLPNYGSPRRILTRIGCAANFAHLASDFLMKELNSLSEEERGESVKLSLQVLSDGLELSKRLEGILAPYLDQ